MSRGLGLEVSFFGFLVLVADIWAVLKVFQSSAGTGAKALWIALILVFPIGGFLLWFFLGPKS